MKVLQLVFWTFVSGAAGALVGSAFGVDPLEAAAVAGAADVVTFLARYASKRRSELEDAVDV